VLKTDINLDVLHLLKKNFHFSSSDCGIMAIFSDFWLVIMETCLEEALLNENLNKKILVHIELLVEPQFLAEFLRNWRKSPKFGTA